MPLDLPPAFTESYIDFASYPTNITDKGHFRSALASYNSQLERNENLLFAEDVPNVDINIPIWDAKDPTTPGGCSPGLNKHHVRSEVDLKARLGDCSVPDPLTGRPVGDVASVADPVCRYILPFSANAQASLKTTKSVMLRLLTYYQVMPAYLDFLSAFGQTCTKRDLRYSAFRERTRLAQPEPSSVIPGLGRSGHHLEVCYNLKTVVCKNEGRVPKRQQEWSIRPAAIYHHFDVLNAKSLWLITTPREEFQKQLEQAVGENGRSEHRDYSSPQKAFESGLAVHAFIAYWATQNWRWYVRWLEEMLEEDTSQAVHGPRVGQKRIYTPQDLQDVQHYEDMTNEAVLILQSNAEVLTKISTYYKALLGNVQFPLRKASQESTIRFIRQLQDMIQDMSMQAARAKLAVKIASDRKNIVLSHLDKQNADKVEDLNKVMLDLTSEMWAMGRQSYREATIVRIITVVTLVYLPATFVSAFFSTDVVKYQNSSPDSTALYTTFSGAAMERWLEVTLPLTLLTLGVAYWWSEQAEKKMQKFDNDALPMLAMEMAKRRPGP